MTALRVACVQMRSGTGIAENIEAASALITEAAAKGATLVATPEMTNLIDIRPGMGRAKASAQSSCPALAAFTALATAHKIWLLIGSIAIALEDEDRLVNRSFLIGPDGTILATYDKIHMFDVSLDDGQTYRESKTYKAGETATLAKTPLGMLGLTICYDLRFPALYRVLAQAGADIITCPAAFTKVTGAAHWHALLRARAIETGAFILAPAQGGHHQDGRETYGHSLIISPWGEIIAEHAGVEPGVLIADIDLSEVAETRARIPALTHDRKVETKLF